MKLEDFPKVNTLNCTGSGYKLGLTLAVARLPSRKKIKSASSKLKNS